MRIEPGSSRPTGRSPDPRNANVRAVLVRSGNRCAFPGCTHPIVNERGQFIAQLCHIEAAAPGGPRFNPAMSDEERRSDSNLILLCHRHHVETDDIALFSVSGLREMKRSHELQFAGQPFAISDETVHKVTREAEEYWRSVDRANSLEHVVPDLRVEIDASASVSDLIGQMRETLASLSRVHHALTSSAKALPEDVRRALDSLGYDIRPWDQTRYYSNPTVNRDWEWLHLGLPNHMSRLSVLLDQLELRLLERDLAADPVNAALQSKIAELRAAFLKGAKCWGLVD